MSCIAPGRASAGAAKRSTPLEAGRQAFLHEDPLLTRTVLSGQLETAFRVQPARGSRAARQTLLRLRKVADLPSAGNTGTEGSDLCFSALFAGPLATPLPQQTYELQHATLGTFSVFLVPVGRPGKELSYEATFNRLDA